MPRRDRSIILAAVGWLALTGQHPNPPAKAEQPQAETRVGDALANIATTYREQTERAERSPETKPCKAGETKRDSELCAQWVAADAAREAAWWAAVSGVLSIAGLLGVAGALILTIQSNRIAADTARRQLRAYLTIEPGGINVAEDGFHRAPYNVKNTGQTPAYNLEVFGDFLIVGNTPKDFDPAANGRFNGQITQSDGSLGAGQNRWIAAYLTEETAEPYWVDIAEKKKAIIHYGFVRYEDAFESTRETHFAFYHWGEELSDLTSLRCRFGNSAT